MRCLAIYLTVIAIGTAAAEPRRTTEAVTVRKKPGEREAVLAQLPAGTEVVVVGEEGRWLRIRVKNVDGYVARTTITAGASATDAPPVWSAPRRGAPGEALTVVVTAPASALHAAPSTASPAVAQVARATKLVVLDGTTDPRWIQVRDDGGHTGWVDRVALDNDVTTVVDGGGELKARTVAVATVQRPLANLVVRTDLGVGYRALGMAQTANASGGLTNYVVDADAMVATLAVGVVARLSPRLFVGFDALAQLSQAAPIAYEGPSSPSGTIPFKTFALEWGAAIGVHAHEAFDLSARAGFHYDAFLADSVDNAGMLPRERLLGATLGARVAIAPPTSRFEVVLRFDALVIGARAQTPGLEDGTASTAHAVWGGLVMRARMTQRWSLFGAYELGHASTHWTGMSTRAPGVTDASRVDSTQLVQLGVSVGL